MTTEAKETDTAAFEQEKVIVALTRDVEEAALQIQTMKNEHRGRLAALHKEFEGLTKQKQAQFDLVAASFAEKQANYQQRIERAQAFKAARAERVAEVEVFRERIRTTSHLIKEKRLAVCGEDLVHKNQNLQIEKENITLEERMKELTRRIDTERRAFEKTNAKSKGKVLELLAQLERAEGEYKRRKLEIKMREDEEAMLAQMRAKEQEELEANARGVRELRAKLTDKLRELEAAKEAIKAEITKKDAEFREETAPLVAENQRLRSRLELGEAVARGMFEQRKLANFLFQRYETLMNSRAGLSTLSRVWRFREMSRARDEPFQRTEDQQLTFLFNLIRSKVYHHKVK